MVNGSEAEKTYFRTSDNDAKGMVELRFALSGASSVSNLRLMKSLRGRNVSPPFLSRLCLMFWIWSVVSAWLCLEMDTLSGIPSPSLCLDLSFNLCCTSSTPVLPLEFFKFIIIFTSPTCSIIECRVNLPEYICGYCGKPVAFSHRSVSKPSFADQHKKIETHHHTKICFSNNQTLKR